MATPETASEVILFKNQHGNCSIVLRSLAVVSFINGKFFTVNAKLQDELKQAADNGEFGVYVDQDEASIDPSAATPMDQLKKKLRDELMAELKAGGKLVDGGSSVEIPGQSQQSLATTADIVGAAELTPEEQALKDKQSAENLSALDKLNKLKAGN